MLQPSCTQVSFKQYSIHIEIISYWKTIPVEVWTTYQHTFPYCPLNRTNLVKVCLTAKPFFILVNSLDIWCNCNVKNRFRISFCSFAPCVSLPNSQLSNKCSSLSNKCRWATPSNVSICNLISKFASLEGLLPRLLNTFSVALS